ncbi:unnamed protein product [Penicillium nalgiovense]|nr:unnamed protein product [Penicillium nalgiovense]
MAKTSIFSLPNELVCQIASDMCVPDIISFIQCCRSLCLPLFWHCQHQRRKRELKDALTACIQTNNVDGTRLLLAINADIECVECVPTDSTPFNRTPRHYWDYHHLYWAVTGGHHEIVEALSEHLTQMKVEIPNLEVNYAGDALWYAAEGGYYAMTKVLLDLDSNNIRPTEHYDRALYSAVEREYRGYVLDRNCCTSSKHHICSGQCKRAQPDYYATVKLLLDSGATLDWSEYYFAKLGGPLETALHTCTSISDGNVKLLVERGANVSAKNVLRVLTVTSNRCTVSHGEIAKFLLDHGADLSSRDHYGRSVLLKANKKDLIQLFIDRGLSPNDVDKCGQTLLNTLAAKEASETRVELMKVLLDLDANVNCRSPSGPTPLLSVFSYRRKQCEYDSDGYVIDRHDQHGDIVTPEPESLDDETYFAFVHKTAKLLLSHGADVRVRDGKDQTVLYKTDNKSLVELILTYGAEVNVVDIYGQTPLHAITYGASEATVGTIEVLLKHGADTSAKNADDNTPLHLAVLTSAWQVVKLLLDHGADRDSRNSDGKSPMDLLAHRRHHREKFLVDKHWRDSMGDRVITYRRQRRHEARFLDLRL